MTKIHRFIGKWHLAHGIVRLDDKELAHQMRSVLKLRSGETVILGDGIGQEAHCKILSYEKDAILVQCISVGRNANEPQAHMILYAAVLKNEHFEMAAAKATEVGAREIVPVISARTIKLKLRLDRVDASYGKQPNWRVVVLFRRYVRSRLWTRHFRMHIPTMPICSSIRQGKCSRDSGRGIAKWASLLDRKVDGRSVR